MGQEEEEERTVGLVTMEHSPLTFTLLSLRNNLRRLEPRECDRQFRIAPSLPTADTSKSEAEPTGNEFDNGGYELTKLN